MISGSHRYEQALADFERAIELDDKAAWAVASRAETYRLQGNFPAALVDFDRAIELNYKAAWAIASRGHVYRAAGSVAVTRYVVCVKNANHRTFYENAESHCGAAFKRLLCRSRSYGNPSFSQ